MTKRNELVKKIMMCPICDSSITVTEDQRSAMCMGARRHCFDFSKDGYLSIPGKSGGDSKEAVDARRRFLDAAYYEPAARAITDVVAEYLKNDSIVIDAGCGEGYYTEMIAERVGGVIGFDLSKFACASASKRAKRECRDNLLYSTASVFELPIKDGVADAVVNIFAPCAEGEYARVLREGGYLFVVGAGKDHLMGLKRAIYDDVYENGERADMPQNMSHVAKKVSKHSIVVEGEDNIAALFSMTPYYWRTSESDKEKLKHLNRLETEIEFEINVYKK